MTIKIKTREYKHVDPIKKRIRKKLPSAPFGIVHSYSFEK